jgi:hypothetical protein
LESCPSIKGEWQWKEIRPLGDFAWLIGAATSPPTHILSFKSDDKNQTSDITIKPFEPRFQQNKSVFSQRSKSTPPTETGAQDSSRRAQSVTHPVYHDQSERIKQLEHLFHSLQQESRLGRQELHQQLNLAQSSFDKNLKKTTSQMEDRLEALRREMPSRATLISDIRDTLLPEIKAIFEGATKAHSPTLKRPLQVNTTENKENSRDLSIERERDRTPRSVKSQRTLRKENTS